MSGAPLALAALALAAVALACAPSAAPDVRPAADGPRWYRGNTHAHTLWSDGDDFPESVARRYRDAGYDFLAITDHNTVAADGQRWWRVPGDGPGRWAYDAARARGDSLEERRSGDTTWVRLRTLAAYRAAVEVPGRFVLVPGEEVTQYLDGRGAHVNALNVAGLVPEQPGATTVRMIERDVAFVDGMAAGARRPMLAVLNHPNFLWSQTAEDILRLPRLRAFEVYNGHPLVHSQGDALHAGTERQWDVVLARRALRGEPPLWGMATDDAHDYHRSGPERRNPGRGWVMVRAGALDPDSLTAAMARGDFHASTGVRLHDVRQEGDALVVEIAVEPGVAYVTTFVGARRGVDTVGVAVSDSTGRALTRRYDATVGAVLAEVRGGVARYVMRGDELYVRARVTSSKPKANPSFAGEMEMAWTQPVYPR
jgi:hypothetical protein